MQTGPTSEKKKKSPIFNAIRDNDYSKVRDLVATCPDKLALFTSTNSQGYTPLYFAALYDRLDIIRLLIANGDDPHREVETSDYDLIQLAACQGHHSTIDYFVREHRIDPTSGLYAAAEEGLIETYDYLVRTYKLNPAQKFVGGDTPLHIAAWRNKCDLFDHLVNVHGLNPYDVNDEGQTPLHIALYNYTEHQVAEMIEHLLRNYSFDIKGMVFASEDDDIIGYFIIILKLVDKIEKGDFQYVTNYLSLLDPDEKSMMLNWRVYGKVLHQHCIDAGNEQLANQLIEELSAILDEADEVAQAVEALAFEPEKTLVFSGKRKAGSQDEPEKAPTPEVTADKPRKKYRARRLFEGANYDLSRL